MKYIARFFNSVGRMEYAFQIVLLAAVIGTWPVWSAVLIARQGFDAAYRDYGGILALPVLVFALLARYVLRCAVRKLTGNRRFFEGRLCILEINPVVGILGVSAAVAAAVAVGLCVNLFWFYIVGFYGCRVFFERVVSPDAR